MLGPDVVSIFSREADRQIDTIIDLLNRLRVEREMFNAATAQLRRQHVELGRQRDRIAHLREELRRVQHATRSAA